MSDSHQNVAATSSHTSPSEALRTPSAPKATQSPGILAKLAHLPSSTNRQTNKIVGQETDGNSNMSLLINVSEKKVNKTTARIPSAKLETGFFLPGGPELLLLKAFSLENSLLPILYLLWDVIC